MSPEVADSSGTGDADVVKVYCHGIRRFAAVEEGHRLAAIREWLHPHLKWFHLADPVTFNALGVLVHDDDFGIGQNLEGNFFSPLAPVVGVRYFSPLASLTIKLSYNVTVCRCKLFRLT